MARRSSVKALNTELINVELPKMLEGYYSGDKPNPNLQTFVEAHIQKYPYNPIEDSYNVKAFDKPIETTKATAIYNMHTYWSKKPYEAILQYIKHFTKPNDLILDPFCGSGGTALSALIEGRSAIAIDLSPAATFITKNYCTPINLLNVRQDFNNLIKKIKPEMDYLYGTKCDKCGGDATIAYIVFSHIYQCPRCLDKIPVYSGTKILNAKEKEIIICPNCYKRNVIEEINKGKRFGIKAVLVSYLCNNGCKPQRDERSYDDANPKKREYFEKYDLLKLKEIKEQEIPYWYPKIRMMNAPDNVDCWGLLYRPESANPKYVSDLYSKINLYALSILLNEIKNIESVESRDCLLFVFSSILLNTSMMYQYRDNLKGGTAKGTYYLPPNTQNMNVLRSFEDKFEDIIRGFKNISVKSTNLMISTSSALDLSEIKSSSIDYIFTDPPYSWKVQFGELNFVWESWLGFNTKWHEDEVIVNEFRGKNKTEWANMMYKAMSECYRVLKPGHWLSLCYHDTSEGTWSQLQDIMAEIGFISDKIDKAIFIDTGQKSWKQIVADKVIKRDLVINYKKPKLGQTQLEMFISGDEDSNTFSDIVKTIITDYLTVHPGSTKDHVFDEVISHMIRSGNMQPHDFDAMLLQVADHVQNEKRKHGNERWYLKGSMLEVQDEAESACEDAAAAKLRKFVLDWIEKNPQDDGVHYSDLFEEYVVNVQDRPRRRLVEWLPDYFYITNNGTYRLPISEEEEKVKANGRANGINRRIKRYLSFILNGINVPKQECPDDATLAEWIRHSKRSGLYKQGKYLFEKGGINLDKLSEEASINVEEDYNVCIKMLERIQPEKKIVKKRSRQKQIDGEEEE